jgi:hypothetical protein
MDPYLAKLITPTTEKAGPPTADPRSLPVYRCKRKDARSS